MRVSASVKLLTVRGIPIRVHASFLLILVWAAWLGWSGSRGDWLRGVAFMVGLWLLIFVCVVLHELGHSLVAQLFGVKVHDITLWPIGGVARIGMPEKPRQEFFITLAGPVTSGLLALLLGLLAVAWIGPDTVAQVIRSPWRLQRLFTDMNGQALLLLLAVNNALMALFNLIPAFPMDGGRLLRSLLAALLPFRQATRVASYIGQVAAAFMGALAVLTGGVFLGLVALFVFAAAWQERQQATTLEALRGLTVRRAMQPLGIRLYALQTLGEAVTQVAPAAQSAFVVVDAGRLVGLVTRAELLMYLRKAGPHARLSQHVPRELPVLAPDDPLLTAQEKLQLRPAAVVVEDGRAIGLLTLGALGRVAEAQDALRREKGVTSNE